MHDLEQRVSLLKEESSTLQADNKLLKLELARLTTEIGILHTMSSPFGQKQNAHKSPTELAAAVAMRDMLASTHISLESHHVTSSFPHRHIVDDHRRTVDEKTGEKLLSPNAAWDFIQSHEFFKKGLVDIAVVRNYLQGHAQCDGQGPAFPESVVRKAVEESVSDGSGGLI